MPVADVAELLEHSDWIRKLAYVLVRNDTQADDLTQEQLARGTPQLAHTESAGASMAVPSGAQRVEDGVSRGKASPCPRERVASQRHVGSCEP